MRELRRNTTEVDNAAIREFVDKIGGRLAAQFPDTSLHFTFAVIAEGRGGYTHEPLAYPGGRIFVPAPLILATGDEAEFAGMLAHAMANEAQQHAQANRGNGPFGPFIWIASEGFLPTSLEKPVRRDGGSDNVRRWL